MRVAWIVCAAAAACPLAAMAEHPERPANLPPLGSANLYFVRDDSGAFHATERGAPGSVDIFVYGWSFDPNVPDSAFIPSSPAYTLTDGGVDDSFWRYVYNSSSIAFERLNVEYLRQSPNAPLGPRRIALFDFSSLKVTDSLLRTDAISITDFSRAEFTNTQLAGALAMQSNVRLKLTGVTPFQRLGDSPGLTVHATKGQTTVASSTLDGLSAGGTALVTVAGSTIRNSVFHQRPDVPTTEVPLTTLSDTPVGKLTAGSGSITMNGGRVQGVVEAFGFAQDPRGAGSISLQGVDVGGSVVASKFGSILISGGSIAGGVTVGDASGASADISVFSANVAGNLQAVGSGKLGVALFQSIGPVLASGDSRVTLSSGDAIQGSVFAVGKSQVQVGFVTAIAGDAFADQGARLSLERTSAHAVGAFGDSTLSVRASQVLSVTADGGDVALRDVEVGGQIVAFGKSSLTLSSSRVAGSVTNFGNGTGVVRIDSGTVGGDLVGMGRSVTAMSGGFVQGSPVFGDQATFLYSGGSFGFADNSVPDSPDDVALQRGTDSAARLELLPAASGFVARGDATIQFIGFGLQSTLVDADVLKNNLRYSVYQLSGELADHSRIDGGLVFVQNAAGTARFMLVEAPPVPEPSVAAMLLLGLTCLGWVRRSRRATPACRAAAAA